MDDHHFFFVCKEFFFEFFYAVYLMRLRRRNVDRHVQKLGQGCCRSAHHLIHDLADGADIHFVHHEFFVRDIHTHEHFDDGFDVLPLEQHDIFTLKPLYIGDLYADGRLDVGKFKFVSGLHTDLGCCNIHPCVQHDGNRCRRGA